MNDKIALIKNTNRDILLAGEVDTGNVKTVINQILQINREDEENRYLYGEWLEIKPISLYLSSFGGSLYDGLALIDLMRTSKTPINTYCLGMGMSMGLWIFIHGNKRYIGERATLMYHDISFWSDNSLEYVKDDLAQLEKMRNLSYSDFELLTNVPIEKLKEVIAYRKEWYLNAHEAIQYEIADGIL